MSKSVLSFRFSPKADHVLRLALDCISWPGARFQIEIRKCEIEHEGATNKRRIPSSRSRETSKAFLGQCLSADVVSGGFAGTLMVCGWISWVMVEQPIICSGGRRVRCAGFNVLHPYEPGHFSYEAGHHDLPRQIQTTNARNRPLWSSLEALVRIENRSNTYHSRDIALFTKTKCKFRAQVMYRAYCC